MGLDVVTWGEFVEAGYLREYRAKQVSLQSLRPVIGFMRERLGVQYPPATLHPYTSGKELALEAQEFVGLEPALSIVILGRDGSLKLADPAVAFLDRSSSATPVALPSVCFPSVAASRSFLTRIEASESRRCPPWGVRTEVLAELVGSGRNSPRGGGVRDVG